MTNSDIKENFILIFNQMFSYLNIEHKFMCEIPESTLNSIAEDNILVGLSGSFEGNFMFGFTQSTAVEMAKSLVGTKNINSVNLDVKSALADLFFDYSQRVINLSHPTEDILLSSPTFVSGDSMKALISKVPAINLFFKINGEKFSVSYYLEKL